MKVVIDIDDVLYPCVDTIRQYLIEAHGYSPDQLGKVDSWDLHDCWAIDHTELWDLVNVGIDAGYVFFYGEPYADVVTSLDKLQSAGHTIHLVTARVSQTPGSAEYYTTDWLKHWKIPYNSLTFSADKTVVKADFALDDKEENASALRDNGVKTFIMDQPWNVNADFPRVFSVSEFVEEVFLCSGGC